LAAANFRVLSAIVHAIVGEGHAPPGDALAARTNRRQNGKRPPICHCEAPTGPWRPEREARGSALGVQFRSTWPDNRKASGEYGTVTRRGVEDAATYKVCAVGDGLHEPQVPSRDCHVALLLAMTHQAGAAAHQCPSAVELPCTRRSLSAAAFFSRTADLYGSPQPTEKYPKFGNKGQNCPFLCHKNMPFFTTCQALFF
jgi:hypothetical protein